jgi:sulfonate transport system permease protein
MTAAAEGLGRVTPDQEVWHGPALPRRLAWKRIPRPVRRLLGPVVLLAGWELASAAGLIDNQTLAGPATVISTAGYLIRTGELQQALLASLHRVAVGLSLGTAAGVVLALISGLSGFGEDLVDGPMQILRALPILALVPLDIVWFGIGEQAKEFLIAFGVAFPVYVNTHAAIRGIDPGLIELSATLRLRRREVLRRMVLPGALPGFIVGFRFAAAIAWLILVVSEQVNANSGLGYMMNQAQVLDQTNVIMVGLLTYGLLGLTSDTIIRMLERRLTTWRPSLAGR